MLGESITRNGLLLGLFALCTTVLIVSTQLGTREEIALQIRMAEERALLEIVPRERHDNTMLDDTLAVGPAAEGLGLRQEKQVYRARRAGEVIAVIVPAVAPDGYTGDIDMIVGVNRDGSIAGVRVLGHRETPGLGDKVDLRKSDWILGFDGRSLSDPVEPGWAVRRDRGVFDQFTGATITPRAVVAAVFRTLKFVQANRSTLFDVSGDAPTGGES